MAAKELKFDTEARARLKAGVDKLVIIEGVTRYINYVAYRRKTDFADLKYRDGSTWFNGKGWEDELD